MAGVIIQTHAAIVQKRHLQADLLELWVLYAQGLLDPDTAKALYKETKDFIGDDSLLY